jgi:ABC-2 type transport system permease protein
MIRNAWFIASRDLKHMLRQKETVLWVFIMPLLFFFFIGTITGGNVPRGAADDSPRLLAVQGPEEGGFMLDELYDALRAQNFEILFVGADTPPDQFRRRLVIPEPAEGTANFTESILAGNQAVLHLVRNGEGTGTNLDQVRLARAIYGLLADLAVLKAEGDEVTLEGLDALQAQERNLSLLVEPAGKLQVIPSGYSQAIPGTMVMFTLLVLLSSAATLLVIERRRGLLRRLAATPISRGSIVLGKWMGTMALGLVQIGSAMIAGRVFFGMDWGDDLPMVLVLLLCWAAFCTSAAIFLANLMRTEQQMNSIGVITSIVLAALGGCWWPIEITPSWMQSLGGSLPTGWAMDGMHQLIHFGNGPSSVLGSLGLLIVSSLVLSVASVRIFRYQ